MAVSDIFPLNPSYAVHEELLHNVLVSEADSGQEQRRLKWANPKRRFRLDLKSLTDTELKSLRDFYLARNAAFDVFSFLPPVNQDRLVTAVPCGTGNGSTTVFYLQNSQTPPYYYRIYTGTGNRNKVYKDGVEQGSGFTLANDDTNKRSTVTFSVAPANGVVITVDVDRYLIMRFGADPYRAALVAFASADVELELVEVFRASI